MTNLRQYYEILFVFGFGVLGELFFNTTWLKKGDFYILQKSLMKTSIFTVLLSYVLF